MRYFLGSGAWTEYATKSARAIRNLGHAVGDHRDRCPRPNHHCRRLVHDSMSLLSGRAAQGWRQQQVSKVGYEVGNKKHDGGRQDDSER